MRHGSFVVMHNFFSIYTKIQIQFILKLFWIYAMRFFMDDLLRNDFYLAYHFKKRIKCSI